MLKNLNIEMNTEDALEAQLVIAYYASDDPAKMLKNCLMVGYLIASGKLRVTEFEEVPDAPGERPNEAKPKKPVGNTLFGIKA